MVFGKNKLNLAFFVPMLFVFLWSTGFIAAKYTIQYSPPFTLLFLRGLLSCIVFLAIVLVSKVQFPSLNGMIAQLKVGFFMHVVFLGGCFFAIHKGMPSSLVALITGLQPILTAVILATVHKQSMRLMKWLGIVIGFIGVFLVLSPGKHSFHLALIPLLSSIIALIGVTIGSLYQKKIKPDGHILASTFFQYVSLTVIMGAISYFTEPGSVSWSFSFVAGLLWLVVGVSVAAILLLVYMIQVGESTKVATYFYLVPVVTAIEAWILFGETITLQTVLGMVVTILGMVFVMLG
ncbi:DMT family transporter [Tolumonas osonensis]|uniref:Drug/metabolite transporter (DMT)-like permease n=1 Tax=Tolumonas osonensis TaxID=675874 RepID=A0A841GF69_9GAMM|nr:DMT family transporter [Tolumonas osonensis]MBB6056217.1 drug/metabolite transporter (DMT)-like permease [Tolumonas osonensis]